MGEAGFRWETAAGNRSTERFMVRSGIDDPGVPKRESLEESAWMHSTLGQTAESDHFDPICRRAGSGAADDGTNLPRCLSF